MRTGWQSPLASDAMTAPSLEQIQVGSVSVPLATAQQWVTEYTNVENTAAANPYAYPAYDQV